MTNDCLAATRVVNATAVAVFAVLTDPGRHAAIDGTGWIRDTAGGEPLTAAGLICRMPMYHAEHPDGDYETANRVEVFDPPHTISWRRATRTTVASCTSAIGIGATTSRRPGPAAPPSP